MTDQPPPAEPSVAQRAAATAIGQRRINLLWERTQTIIAVSVVEVTLAVVCVLIFSQGVSVATGQPVNETSSALAATGLVLLSNLVGNVTGFYFARTNHTKVGGVSGTREGDVDATSRTA